MNYFFGKYVGSMARQARLLFLSLSILLSKCPYIEAWEINKSDTRKLLATDVTILSY